LKNPKLPKIPNKIIDEVIKEDFLYLLNVPKTVKPVIGLFSLVFSVIISASYSLGPDTGAVSGDEYAAMEKVWSEDRSSPTHCVVADVYPLLALEKISAKQVVGGGFPINQYFAQPELTAIMGGIKQGVSVNLLARAKYITNAKQCWLVGNFNYGRPPEAVFGKIKVWKF